MHRKTPISFRPIASVLSGILIIVIFLAASGYNVGSAFSALWIGATGIQIAPISFQPYQLAQSLANATPLLFTGLSVAIGMKAGLFNIGAQGQLTFGAFATAVVGFSFNGMPAIIHICLALGAGAIAGAIWGAIPALLKSARGVHEVISTIMLNYVASDITSYMVTHSLKDRGSQAPQTAAISKNIHLHPFVPGSLLNAGIFIALSVVALSSWFISRTSWGFRIRAVGESREAAETNGVPITATLLLAMALSGAAAGLAGAVMVLGQEHRFVKGMSGSYGFDGIAVALLGGNSGLGVTLSALFFGGLASGANNMQLLTNVPDSIATVVQAVVIFFAGVRSPIFHSKRGIKKMINTRTGQVIHESPPD